MFISKGLWIGLADFLCRQELDLRISQLMHVIELGKFPNLKDMLGILKI